MKNYAIVGKYTAMKGFFKKKPHSEYILVGIKDNKRNSFILVQFFDTLKPGMYVCAIVGVAQSPDEEILEQHVEYLRYDANIVILEDKVPINTKFGNIIKIIFTKPSKILGKTLELLQDSRLPSGYFIAKCKLKKGVEPSARLKVGAGAMNVGNLDMGEMKKMRAFTTARLKSIMKQ